MFQSWGRISTVIGSKSLTSFITLEDALEKFHTVYLEKTGNEFGKKTWVKRPNKFYHIDIEMSMPKQMPTTFVDSKLEHPLYELMEMLFDIKRMRNMMCACDLDLKQMPLGKISTKQIETAMSTLKSISRLIRRNGTPGQLRDASNKFYTLIPHAFSVKRPPVIDSMETVDAKNELLESLLSMETIYGFLEGENGIKINPLDACYGKLNAKIVPIPKSSFEFNNFAYIVRNTHGTTHRNYSLEVLEIFKVVRDGEDDSFRAFNDLNNHRLLWHGSRLMNYVGILSNGLKIAPYQSLHSGYMFGKGIYFADVVSKSANYCFTNIANDTGLVLLCEVALGNMQSHVLAKQVTDIPNNEFHSVKALGAIFPTAFQFIDGSKVASGDLRTIQGPRSLYYNEYVVYNPDQVKIKYLFKMKFHYHNQP